MGMERAFYALLTRAGGDRRGLPLAWLAGCRLLGLLGLLDDAGARSAIVALCRVAPQAVSLQRAKRGSAPHGSHW